MAAGKFYITADGDPYFNMALDEWAFGKVRNGAAACRAMLRLYTWSRGAITFGYNQKFEKAVDISLLDTETPIIRRITGGRAIYHDPTELTFTVILDMSIIPEKDRSLSATNAMISEALVAVLSRMGCHVGWLDHSDRNFLRGVQGRKKSCFGSVSKYEVIDGANKIAGGAQRRIGDSLIHQGSIKLNGISACPAVGQEPVGPTVGSENMNKYYTLDRVSPVFGAIFSDISGINFEPAEFSASDMEEIEKNRVNIIEKSLERR